MTNCTLRNAPLAVGKTAASVGSLVNQPETYNVCTVKWLCKIAFVTRFSVELLPLKLHGC